LEVRPGIRIWLTGGRSRDLKGEVEGKKVGREEAAAEVARPHGVKHFATLTQYASLTVARNQWKGVLRICINF